MYSSLAISLAGVHGALMGVVWLIMVPAAIAVARHYKDSLSESWLRVHVIINGVFAPLLTVIGVSFLISAFILTYMLRSNNGVNFTSITVSEDNSMLTIIHRFLGVIVMIVIPFQIALGVYIDNTYKPSLFPARKDRFHWYIGRFLLFLAISEIGIGVVLYTSYDTIYGFLVLTLFCMIGVVVGIVILYLNLTRKRSRPIDRKGKRDVERSEGKQNPIRKEQKQRDGSSTPTPVGNMNSVKRTIASDAETRVENESHSNSSRFPLEQGTADMSSRSSKKRESHDQNRDNAIGKKRESHDPNGDESESKSTRVKTSQSGSDISPSAQPKKIRESREQTGDDFAPTSRKNRERNDTSPIPPKKKRDSNSQTESHKRESEVHQHKADIPDKDSTLTRPKRRSRNSQTSAVDYDQKLKELNEKLFHDKRGKSAERITESEKKSEKKHSSKAKSTSEIDSDEGESSIPKKGRRSKSSDAVRPSTGRKDQRTSETKLSEQNSRSPGKSRRERSSSSTSNRHERKESTSGSDKELGRRSKRAPDDANELVVQLEQILLDESQNRGKEGSRARKHSNAEQGKQSQRPSRSSSAELKKKRKQSNGSLDKENKLKSSNSTDGLQNQGSSSSAKNAAKGRAHSNIDLTTIVEGGTYNSTVLAAPLPIIPKKVKEKTEEEKKLDELMELF